MQLYKFTIVQHKIINSDAVSNYNFWFVGQANQSQLTNAYTVNLTFLFGSRRRPTKLNFRFGFVLNSEKIK